MVILVVNSRSFVDESDASLSEDISGNFQTRNSVVTYKVFEISILISQEIRTVS